MITILVLLVALVKCWSHIKSRVSALNHVWAIETKIYCRLIYTNIRCLYQISDDYFHHHWKWHVGCQIDVEHNNDYLPCFVGHRILAHNVPWIKCDKALLSGCSSYHDQLRQANWIIISQFPTLFSSQHLWNDWHERPIFWQLFCERKHYTL